MGKYIITVRFEGAARVTVDAEGRDDAEAKVGQMLDSGELQKQHAVAMITGVQYAFWLNKEPSPPILVRLNGYYPRQFASELREGVPVAKLTEEEIVKWAREVGAHVPEHPMLIAGDGDRKRRVDREVYVHDGETIWILDRDVEA